MDERLHNGGAMAFGNDGKLYITTGDAGKRKNADPLNNVHGSIIRLNEDGTVPDDNPYTKASGYENSYRCADTEGRVPSDAPENSVCAEVWANGLRNPFRIDMDPNVKDKVKFSFGVVGAQHIEAIYFGGTDYKGTNYGWPKYEGVCKPGDMENCNPLDDDPSLTMPFHWYAHISFEDGGCVGGQVHVPEGIWPPEFKYLFIDFILLKIYSLELDRPDLACWDCDPPLPPTRNETFYESIREEGDNINEARMVEMWFGPYEDTQALYFTKFGNHDTVIRIRYTGILNKPPVPSFELENHGDLSVTFDASNTKDAEGDDLKFAWDFGDETEIVSKEMVLSHEYSEPGEYTTTLSVTDTSGQKQQVSETVKIGTVPTVSILSPLPSTTFAVGQVLRLNGEAYDFQGNLIPDDRLTWEVRQHHANHFHPFLDLTIDNDFDLYPAPEPEDFFAATNSFLKVILTAADEYGLTETVWVDVQPNTIIVNVTTEPAGLDVMVDGYDVETPQLITSWKGFKLPVTVTDQPPYLFKKWSDDRTARSRVFQIYQKDGAPMPEVRAIFCTDLGSQCESNDNCCSGYCSPELNNMCAPVPGTLTSTMETPSYVEVSDSLSDIEIDVDSPHTDNGRPLPDIVAKKPIVGDSSTSITTDTSIGLTENNIESESEINAEKDSDPTTVWITLLSIILVILVVAWYLLKRNLNAKDKNIVDSVAQNMFQERYCDYDSEGARSKTGNDEECYDGDIKATGTGSTEQSEGEQGETSSQVSKDNDVETNDISASFLVPESLASEQPHSIHDVEKQNSAVPVPESTMGTVAAAQFCVMPPLSPAHPSPKIRSFDSCEQEAAKPKVGEAFEYRFDALSTSQSSLFPPPLSTSLDQSSFHEGDGSVSFSISSPQKSVDEQKGVASMTIVENMPNLLPYRFDAACTSQSSLVPPPPSPTGGQPSFQEEDGSVAFSVSSPQERIVKILPDLPRPYRFDAASTSQSSLAPPLACPTGDEPSFHRQDSSVAFSVPSPDKSSLHQDGDLVAARTIVENAPTSVLEPSFSFLLPQSTEPAMLSTIQSDTAEQSSTLEEESNEDDRVLDLLLVDTSESGDSLTETGAHEESPLLETDTKANVEDGHVDKELDSVLLKHVDEQPPEDSSILSELSARCSPEEQLDSLLAPTELVIRSTDDDESDLSPLKSPSLNPLQTDNACFLSPEVSHHQSKAEIETTPDTLQLSYDEKDSSLDDSTSFDSESENRDPKTPNPPSFPSTGNKLNLQMSFDASASHSAAQHTRKVEASSNDAPVQPKLFEL